MGQHQYTASRETLMAFLRKAAIVVATAAMTIGLAGVSAPANASDTGWDCPGCRNAPGTPK